MDHWDVHSYHVLKLVPDCRHAISLAYLLQVFSHGKRRRSEAIEGLYTVSKAGMPCITSGEQFSNRVSNRVVCRCPAFLELLHVWGVSVFAPVLRG